MGERGVAEPATAAERASMAEIAGQAVRDGAAGFSTSRFLGHFLPDGRHVPGTHAEHEELVEIARAVGAAGGLMQNVLNLSGDFEGEMTLLREQAEASGQRILFSITAGSSEAFGDRVTEAVMAMRADGLDVNAVCIPRASGFVSGLQSMPLWRGPTWKALAGADLETRLRMVNDAKTVEALTAEASSGEGFLKAEDAFSLGDGDRPDYLAGEERSLASLAKAAGESPAETWLRHARESEGRALFVVRLFNKNPDALARLLGTEFCLPGLGDAGAHVSQIMDSGWGTFVLSHWARDTGFYTLEEAVRRITAEPARIMGLDDRGSLAPGKRADLNVIDLDALGECMPRIVHDFPNGAPRFVQRGTGYRATLCNGIVISRDDELTGARPGRLAH
jgi:N-acyl-D-aspartate/D-glutamate deacylase